MSLRRLLPLAIIATIALGACGAATVLAPRLALSKGAGGLADSQRLSFTVSLVGTPADAVALFGDGEPVSDDDRTGMLTLLRSRLSVVFDKGDDAQSSADDRGAFDVQVGDVAHALEIRTIGKTIYLRARVEEIAQLFGASPAELKDALGAAKSMGFGFVQDAVDGAWLSADITPLESYMKGLAGAEGADIPEFGADQFKDLLGSIGKALGSDVDVKRIGSDDVGDHLRLSASARRVVQALLPALQSIPGFPTDELDADLNDVPDKDFHTDVWLKDGRIVRGEFDLAQFSDLTDPPHVILRVDIDRDPAAISAPDGAKKVDLVELFARFSNGFGSDSGSFESGGEDFMPAFDSEQLKACQEAMLHAGANLETLPDACMELNRS